MNACAKNGCFSSTCIIEAVEELAILPQYSNLMRDLENILCGDCISVPE